MTRRRTDRGDRQRPGATDFRAEDNRTPGYRPQYPTLRSFWSVSTPDHVVFVWDVSGTIAGRDRQQPDTADFGPEDNRTPGLGPQFQTWGAFWWVSLSGHVVFVVVVSGTIAGALARRHRILGPENNRTISCTIAGEMARPTPNGFRGPTTTGYRGFWSRTRPNNWFGPSVSDSAFILVGVIAG